MGIASLKSQGKLDFQCHDHSCGKSQMILPGTSNIVKGLQGLKFEKPWLTSMRDRKVIFL